MVNDALLKSLIKRDTNYNIILSRGVEKNQCAVCIHAEGDDKEGFLLPEEIHHELFDNIMKAISFEITSFYDLQAKHEIDVMTN